MKGMGNMADKVHVIYSGQVQGVGFRWTTARIGRRFPVTGHVKNLPDRTVELEAQGAREELEAFLAAVDLEMKGNIDRASVVWSTGPAENQSFEIRH
jgi:acylphosphatase